MKLYSTITSERASKGQGGNKYLKIEILVGSKDNQVKLADLLVEKSPTIQDEYIISLLNDEYSNRDDKKTLIRGVKVENKKQKDEKCACDGCNNVAEQYYKGEKYCDGHYTSINEHI